jgi:NADPH:quinone reductase-like Zn-dependent oxidoreductase
MIAMRLTGVAGEVELVEDTIPQPQPGPGEILVRVYAAGVTPTEVIWYPTSHTKDGGIRRHAVPEHEFSGVVAGLGEGVAGVHAGEEIYGLNDWFSDGAMAEYCITVPASVAPKPRSLTHVQAATVPIGALTAWQGLFDRAHLQSGERVLVHGGAGSVGIFAVQLARLHGAQVIATASARDAALVSELGASKVIDYRTERFEEMAGRSISCSIPSVARRCSGLGAFWVREAEWSRSPPQQKPPATSA